MKCKVEGCDRKYCAGGYCAGHYQRVQRTGSPGPAEISLVRNEGKVCRMDGCDSPVSAKGLCNAHRLKLSRYGDPSINKPRPPMSDEHKAKLVAINTGNEYCKGKQNALGKTWTMTDEGKSNLREAWVKRRENLPNECSYQAAHLWLKRHAKKKGVCEACDKKVDNGYQTHWANITGQNVRDRDNYWELCVPCHKVFDMLKIMRTLPSDVTDRLFARLPETDIRVRGYVLNET